MVTYFDWLCKKISVKTGDYRENYSTLAYKLFTKEFYYSIERDSNRDFDGKKLRESYIDTFGEPASDIPNGPARVLEVLIALAERCDSDIMYDPNLGDRTGFWFWTFLSNVGLDIFNNSRFDDALVDDILNTWLDRRIGFNGENGIFPLKNSEQNQQEIELWYQLMAFLNENFVTFL